MTPRSQYSMIFLGTDTIVETKNADGTYKRNTGFYERGETLNAIYQAIGGTPLQDKHIISGPLTLGKECDQRAAEGLLMLCRASCEMTSITTAGHSRGAIIMLVTLHRYQEILNSSKKGLTAEEFREEIIRIASSIYRGNHTVNCIHRVSKNDTLIKFDTYINDVKGPTLEFDAAILLKKLIENNPPRFSALMIDPVAGQSNVVSSWREKEFYTLPDFVAPESSLYVALANERTKQFELTFVRSATGRPIPTRVLLSDHGTAMGALDVHGSLVESGKIGKDSDTIKGNRGLKTRHAQKLLVSWLVDFFDIQATHDAVLSGEKDRRERVPNISKTIMSYMIKRGDQGLKRSYQLKRYEKHIQEIDESAKLKHISYNQLVLGKYRASEPRPVYIDVASPAVKMSDIPELHVPPRGYVNQHHIELALDDFKYQIGQGGYQFIFSQLSIFILSFENPNDKHKNQASKDCDNQDIVKYLCDNSHQGHKMAGYFYLVMEKYVNEAFTKLLQNGSDELKKQELARIVATVKSLFAAIKKYKENGDNRPDFRKNAKQVRKAMMESWDVVGANFKNQLQAKLDEFSSRLEGDEDKNILRKQLDDFLAGDLALAKEVELLSASHYDELAKRANSYLRIAEEKIKFSKYALSAGAFREEAKAFKEEAKASKEKAKAFKEKAKASQEQAERDKEELSKALERKDKELSAAAESLCQLQQIRDQELSKAKESLCQLQRFYGQHSYRYQLQQLVSNHNKVCQDSELKYWLREVHDSIKGAANEMTQEALCRTLLTVNSVIHKPGEGDKLHLEANKYLNQQSPQLQKIGYALMGLAIVSALATIALCVLTMGVAVLPMMALYGAIFTGAVTVGSVVGSRYAFFAAEQPPVHVALMGLEEVLRHRL